MVKAKLILAATILSLVLASCSKPELPYFLRLEQVQVQKASKEMMELRAQATYHNPTRLKGTILRSEFELFLDDKLISEVKQDHSASIPARSDFNLPIQMRFDPNQLLQKDENLLLNAVKAFLDQELELHYVGYLYVAILGKEIAIPVDYSEKLELGEYLKQAN